MTSIPKDQCFKRAYSAEEAQDQAELLKIQEPGFSWFHCRCISCGEFHIVRGKLEKNTRPIAFAKK